MRALKGGVKVAFIMNISFFSSVESIRTPLRELIAME